MIITIDTIKHHIDDKYLMSECDALQDRTDKQAGKHVEIPVTVALLAELTYRSEIAGQKRNKDE